MAENQKKPNMLRGIPVLLYDPLTGKFTEVTPDNINEIKEKNQKPHTTEEIVDIVNESLRNDDDDYAIHSDGRVFILKIGSEKYFPNGYIKSALANEISEKDIDWKAKTLSGCGKDIKIEFTQDEHIKKITNLSVKKK